MMDDDVGLYIVVYVYITQFLLYLIDQYVDLRQYMKMKEITKVPAEIMNIYEENQFKKSRLYEMDKFKFNFIKSAYDFCILMMIVYYNGISIFYKYCEFITGTIIGLDASNELYVNLVFITTISIISTIKNLPFSIYYTFVLEEKYGFNKQTIKFFVKDKIKKLIVGIILSDIISTVVVYIIMISGSYAYIYTPLAILAIQIFIVSIYQDYIAPIFDKFVPLKKGPLYDMIDKLASGINFPLGRILLVEGSQRSSHSNAYFIGIFGKRTIVLYDTLFKNLNNYIENPNGKSDGDSHDDSNSNNNLKLYCNDEEIVAILAHELGHWKHNHVMKNILISMIETIVTFYIFGKLSNYAPIYSVFGFHGNRPILIGLTITFMFILSPILFIFGLFTTYISRMFEFQADLFSVNLGYGDKLGSSLKVLQVSNLSFPIYDTIYSCMNHSHPPLLQRLDYINKMSEKLK